MGYIYCITNLINNKRYVGKTTLDPLKRFLKHCRDSLRKRNEKRPLYDAMNKYGIENFKVETLEKGISEEMLSLKEIYWINELGTYGSNGYNATKGGDGKILYDYQEIIDLLKLGYSVLQVSDKIGCCHDIVYRVAKAHSIRVRRNNSYIISLYDLAGNYILTFTSVLDAMDWLVDRGLAKNRTATTKITNCCKHKTKTAYKYRWEFETTL